MEIEEIKRRLDEAEDEWPASYRDLENGGKSAIDVLETGIEDAPVYADPDEILEESPYTAFTFTTVVNLLCRTEILPTWRNNNTQPFKVSTREYSSEDVIAAYEYVSGKKYVPLKDRDPRSIFR